MGVTETKHINPLESKPEQNAEVHTPEPVEELITESPERSKENPVTGEMESEMAEEPASEPEIESESKPESKPSSKLAIECTVEPVPEPTDGAMADGLAVGETEGFLSVLIAESETKELETSAVEVSPEEIDVSPKEIEISPEEIDVSPEDIDRLREDGIEGRDKEQKEASESVTLEETAKEVLKTPTKKYRAIILSGMIIIFTLLGIYVGMMQYFKNHFYWGSVINGIDVSGKTVDEVKEIMASEFKDYRLKLKERGGKIEYIKSAEIGLTYGSDKEINSLKESQNSYLWVSAYFNKDDFNMILPLTYDDKLLKERINQLSCLKPANMIEPKNPTLKYVKNRYVIIDGVAGSKVNKDKLYSSIVDAISKGKTELDLDSAGCYVKPKYTAKSKKVIDAKNTLNKYVSTKITYIYRDVETTLDGAQINRWITIDKNYNISINQQKVKEFISKLSNTYNTVGITRDFLTSYGDVVKVSGGDYGKAIDFNKEMQNLIAEIKEGKTVTKQPEFHGSNDIGNTYVEISLSKQHIWFYKNGSLIVDGDIVTGNVSRNLSTRKGVFTLKSKSRNVILSGPGYAVHVDFWMPYDGGIGIHDAKWRSAFGKNIYLTNGSHGCVNCPYDVAKKIFDNITTGTPVICY